MRALVCKEYGPPEKLLIEAHSDPVPGAGEVLVDIKAAGINFPDVLVIAGKYQVKVPTPFIPGNESAGIVSAVGSGVTQYSVGDRVIINSTGGAFAEKCVADAHATVPLPDDLSFEQGAGFHRRRLGDEVRLHGALEEPPQRYLQHQAGFLQD